MDEKDTTFHLKYLKSLIGDKGSCVELHKGYRRKIVLNPTHLDNVKASVREILNCTITTFDKTLNGIILNYEDLKIPEYFLINEDGSFDVNVIADVYIFRPKIGSVLQGTVNIKGQNRMSCLVHHVFIVTIQESLDPNQNEWLRNQLNIGDEVIFRIADIDLNEDIPYIKGLLLDSRASEGESQGTVSKVKKNYKRNLDDISHVQSIDLQVTEDKFTVDSDITKRADENTAAAIKVRKKHKKQVSDDSQSVLALGEEENINNFNTTMPNTASSDETEENRSVSHKTSKKHKKRQNKNSKHSEETYSKSEPLSENTIEKDDTASSELLEVRHKQKKQKRKRNKE